MCLPVWPRRNGRKQMMIPHKPHQRLRRKLQTRLVRRRTPDCRRHRDQIIIPERLRVPFPLQVRPNRDTLRLLIIQEEQIESILVEPNDIEDEPPVSEPEEVPSLCEEAFALAAPFELATVAGDGEGHFCGRDWDAEMVEEVDEVGVGGCVHHYETCIYLERAIWGVEGLCVGVASETILR